MLATVWVALASAEDEGERSRAASLDEARETLDEAKVALDGLNDEFAADGSASLAHEVADLVEVVGRVEVDEMRLEVRLVLVLRRPEQVENHDSVLAAIKRHVHRVRPEDLSRSSLDRIFFRRAKLTRSALPKTWRASAMRSRRLSSSHSFKAACSAPESRQSKGGRRRRSSSSGWLVEDDADRAMPEPT